MPQPQLYVARATELFDERGVLINHDNISSLETFLQTFAAWIEMTRVMAEAEL